MFKYVFIKLHKCVHIYIVDNIPATSANRVESIYIPFSNNNQYTVIIMN